MMMGIHFMGDVPFRDVYIHAIVRDAEGKKMSKSKGNVIDPLEVIDRYGADSFRFTLAAFAAQGRDIKLSEDRIEGYRHFVNKIWNSARLVLTNLDGDSKVQLKEIVYSMPDRWILTRLGIVSGEGSRALDEYRVNDAASLCYQFVWHEFCDWYLEMIKERLYGDDELLKGSARAVIRNSLMGVLRLLHPFMPFITEEIWHRLAVDKGSIMYADFPAASEFLHDRQALEEMGLVMDIITAIRNIRGEMNISPSKKVDILAEIPENSDIEVIRQNLSHIKNLAKIDSIEIFKEVSKPKASGIRDGRVWREPDTCPVKGHYRL